MRLSFPSCRNPRQWSGGRPRECPLGSPTPWSASSRCQAPESTEGAGGEFPAQARGAYPMGTNISDSHRLFAFAGLELKAPRSRLKPPKRRGSPARSQGVISHIGDFLGAWGENG